jgi:DNA invertase Pin-like site-specific DNA recombinase
MEKPYKVAVYCRVATEAQLAIDCQKEALTQYANAMGHHNLAYYITTA